MQKMCVLVKMRYFLYNESKLKIGGVSLKNTKTTKLTLSAMFLALGFVLPFLTGQIPQIGNMLLPMHIPVLLCGLICGWQYGFVVGLCLPLLRSMIFGMPPIFPTGIAMTFELAAYGLIIGLIYQRAKQKNVLSVYTALICSMLGGRIVWGIVRVLLTGVGSNAFTWKLFMEGAFLTAIPGIILQLILIPVLMAALSRSKLVPLREKDAQKV